MDEEAKWDAHRDGKLHQRTGKSESKSLIVRSI